MHAPTYTHLRPQINISFMTVSRTSRNEEALMAIGIDSEPAPAILEVGCVRRVRYDTRCRASITGHI